MTDKINTLKEFTMVALSRFDNTTKKINAKNLDWKACNGANSVRRILTHMSTQWNKIFPQVLELEVNDWPEDYVGNVSYKLEKILSDLENVKDQLMNGLDNLPLKN